MVHYTLVSSKEGRVLKEVLHEEEEALLKSSDIALKGYHVHVYKHDGNLISHYKYFPAYSKKVKSVDKLITGPMKHGMHELRETVSTEKKEHKKDSFGGVF